jgi:hypothetical protein
VTLAAEVNGPWAQTWKEAWELTSANFKLSADDPDRLDLTQLFYYPYTRGALVLAKHLQIPSVDPSLDWAEGQLDRVISGRKPFAYKWALV